MAGHIYIIGMGPGEKSAMSEEAYACMEKSDVIVGYTVYIDLVKDYFKEKEFFTTPMKQEIERCRACFEFALSGKDVAFICSGDAGVYGMAAPMFELLPEYVNTNSDFTEDNISVIPGVTAAISGAAVLGAPINHDFCVISLSDLLTPWEAIERRIRCAIEGDFAIALYNPSSHKRHDYLQKACDIMLSSGAKENRACGYVENIGREGERAVTCTLLELRTTSVNMFTTVFIGNSNTKIINNRLVTPRGYKL
ncbi:precorrin-3B C(17)-methyltransferase [Pseudobutyrivibrio xylanivorans]|uniref:Precorrin-3B C(17)-methyltransferase n=1 Tax=Pseudobutyrivibrio xylanivorans TaxID=185007 RepID=A0A5P6VTJ1_PSEXY|nr:precorrin-3B C(17)-methyltransferase [Pseudobutyrivibrio xylanivorans]QFJ55956.1 precorrin-3B C(17)-methyltransferase [Pseudobutyrivibrio xylanivorans]